MPSIQVTGQLVDPTTGVEGSADIRIASVINYGQTTKKSISHKSTDASGNYDFQLVYGKHLIFVKYEDERIYIPIGYAVVGDSTPDPIDLIQLINLSDENPPSELVTELQQLREDTLNDIVDTSAQVLENAGYQGEWVSGTSTALKGETWQVNGRYYVALKDTSTDPINDNDNWREVVNTESVTTAQNDIVGGSIFKGSNGEYAQDGDTVTAGTTHLRVLIGGNPTIVSMSTPAIGLISNLNETSATIGGVIVNFMPWRVLNYFSGGEKSAIENMISGIPEIAKVGDVASTGKMVFIRKSVSNPAVIGDFLRLSDSFVLDSGAVGDGVTEDNSAFLALTDSGQTLTSNKKLTHNLNDLAARADFKDISINHSGSTQPIRPVEVLKLRNVDITSSYHGLQVNTVINNAFVFDANIDAVRFGMLFNTGVNGSKNTKLLFSNSYSDEADGIEYNSVGGLSSLLMTVGNTVSGGANGTGSTSGLSIGIAETKSMITALNFSENSRNRAYHTEACDIGNVCIGNLLLENAADGAFLQPVKESDTQKSGVQFGANYLDAAIGNAGIGIHNTFRTSAEGSYKYSMAFNNHIVGFNEGIRAPFGQDYIADGNSIKDAITGINADRSKVQGANMMHNVDTLLKSTSLTSFDSVHSSTNPNDILAATTDATRSGATVKEFSFRKPYSHSGASATEWFQLFKIGRLFDGRVTLRINEPNNWFFATAKIQWDNTTLTSSDQLKQTAGNIFGTIGYRENGGYLEVSIGSASAVTDAEILIEFDGIYYRWTS